MAPWNYHKFVYIFVYFPRAEGGQVSEAKPLAPNAAQGTDFGFIGIGFRILAQVTVSITTVVVGLCIIRVKLDGLGVVVDGILVLA